MFCLRSRHSIQTTGNVHHDFEPCSSIIPRQMSVWGKSSGRIPGWRGQADESGYTYFKGSDTECHLCIITTLWLYPFLFLEFSDHKKVRFFIVHIDIDIYSMSIEIELKNYSDDVSTELGCMCAVLGKIKQVMKKRINSKITHPAFIWEFLYRDIIFGNTLDVVVWERNDKKPCFSDPLFVF